jgi:hypothetical protein
LFLRVFLLLLAVFLQAFFHSLSIVGVVVALLLDKGAIDTSIEEVMETTPAVIDIIAGAAKNWRERKKQLSITREKENDEIYIGILYSEEFSSIPIGEFIQSKECYKRDDIDLYILLFRCLYLRHVYTHVVP